MHGETIYDFYIQHNNQLTFSIIQFMKMALDCPCLVCPLVLIIFHKIEHI